MPVDDQQLFELTEQVWTSMLGLDIALGNGHDPAAAKSRRLVGCVVISGSWEGAVSIECPLSVAQRAAGVMFGSDAAQASDEEVRDALGELANMIGGSVKSLLPSPSQLSLPTVAEGDALVLSVPGTHELRHVSFQSEGEACRVVIAAKAEQQA